MDVVLAELAKCLSIFGLAWFSFWPAIPTGLALGLHPIVVILITSGSYISGILLILLPAHSIRAWIIKCFGKNFDKSSDKDSVFMQIWQRYGVIGFGLVAPMTVGAQLGAMLGVTLNISRNQLILWMTLGVIAWSIGLTLLAVAGVSFISTI